ncbi:MAG: formyltetrahydrofolate deformylase, partial [Bacilli bacterium]
SCHDFQNRESHMKESFAQVAHQFQMTWTMHASTRFKKVALFVSRDLNCMQELLWAWQNGELPSQIAVIISNHPDAKPYADALEIPFYHVPSTKDNRAEAESEQIEIIERYGCELVVLARYMQILTPNFVGRFPNAIINIHHSFLPAFVGAKPYERAYERGVKLIGATSHYVTDDLDEGPIIEQDVFRVDHRLNVEHLKNVGARVERTVLARAVRWHLEDRVLVHGNKTIVFN